jgi:ubiquinone/menaquinone biosynthesis C-methylase UbiE
MQNNQTEKFYTDDSVSYDERWVKKGGGVTNESQLRIVDMLTADWRDCKVLEVGCGSGRFSVPLAKVNPEMILLDLSDAMLQSTLNKVGRSHKGLNASVYQIPLPDSMVEKVISVNVFNHVEDLPKALAEVNRVLVDGGEFIVNITNLCSYFWLAGVLVNRKQKSIGRDVYSKWFAPKAFQKMLMGCHFEVLETVGNVFVPIYLDLPVIREMLFLLDRISRKGVLRWLAPTIFFKCRKAGNLPG